MNTKKYFGELFLLLLCAFSFFIELVLLHVYKCEKQIIQTKNVNWLSISIYQAKNFFNHVYLINLHLITT